MIVEGETIGEVESFCYLGRMLINYEGGEITEEIDIDHRVQNTILCRLQLDAYCRYTIKRSNVESGIQSVIL